MNAIDTNLLVRYLVRDDIRQYERAGGVIEGAPFLLLTTVLLETEWVLRYTYDYAALKVSEALEAVAALPTVVLEAPDTVALALRSMRDGLDFADALHLAGAGECETFYTFDKALVRGATRRDGPKVVAP